LKAGTPVIALFAIALAVALSGCLGGGGGGEDEPEFETFQSEATFVGSGDGLAQAQPVTIVQSHPVQLDNEMITEITFIIDVEDGDPDTNTDNVDGINIIDANGDATSLGGGSTPYTQTATITWDGTTPMNSTWTVEFSVIIAAGDDTWIGPLLWVGTPDNGFQYNIAVNYTFIAPKM
jgi:hypothetical protein